MDYSPVLLIALAFALLSGSVRAQQGGGHLNAAPEEGLFVRRILEFWKDNDTPLVLSQIKQFLKEYPRSEFADSLLAIQGDIHWSQSRYKEALDSYDRIRGPAYREKVLPNRLDCLYQLGRYAALSKETKAYVPAGGEARIAPENQIKVFYHAEAEFELGKTETGPASKQRLETARALFEKLLDTEHAVNSKMALAEIHSLQGRPEMSSGLYFEIADLVPEKKEECLLHAVTEQLKYDPDKALDTLTVLQRSGGVSSAAANLKKLSNLFEREYYNEILAHEEEYLKYADAKTRPAAELLLGRSHYNLQQYGKALEYLQNLLEPARQSAFDNAARRKSVLLTILMCGYHTNDLQLVEKTAGRIEEEYPGDPSVSKALYIRALAYKNSGRLTESRELMERIIKECPAFEKIDGVYFERAWLLYKQNRWDEARLAFIDLVKKHPESRYAKGSWPYIPSSTLQLLEQAETQGLPCDDLREMLIGDLRMVLNVPGVIRKNQKGIYLAKLGKTLYDLKRYDQAKECLAKFVQEAPSDSRLYQAHLVLAMCALDGSHDPLEFAEHAEKVLSLKPDVPEQQKLHLNLFNAYLQLSKGVPGAERENDGKVYADKAAEHLYDVVMSGGDVIQLENQLWLANYFYQKARGNHSDYIQEPLKESFQIEAARKGIEVYRKVLPISDFDGNLEIARDELFLEPEIFKFSNLYAWLQENSRQAAILTALIARQDAHPDWAWNLRARAKFTLANACLLMGNEAQALEIYKQIAASPSGADPYILNASKLYLSRYAYQTLENGKKNLENPDVMVILKNLKDLQIRKTLAQEPIHLEAALEYAKIRSSLEPEEKQDEQMRFLLKRAKQDFNSQEDIASKDYQAARAVKPEKDLIFRAYMMLIDGHIARLDAKMAKLKGENREAELKYEIAQSLYKNLTHGQFAVSKYVVDQAQSSLKELHQ